MATLRQNCLIKGGDGATAYEHVVTGSLAGRRISLDEGGGAVLVLGDYELELTKSELALVSMLGVQRPVEPSKS
jgi:hypothetical protein